MLERAAELLQLWFDYVFAIRALWVFAVIIPVMFLRGKESFEVCYFGHDVALQGAFEFFNHIMGGLLFLLIAFKVV